MPGFSTSLAYYDTYRRENVPANPHTGSIPGLLVSPGLQVAWWDMHLN